MNQAPPIATGNTAQDLNNILAYLQNIDQISMGTWNYWVPIFTGFSIAPIVVARYCLIGKLCTISIYSLVAGTSDDIFFTMTLPFPATNVPAAQLQLGFSLVVNNGNPPQIGMVEVAQGSNILTIYADVDRNGWNSNPSNKYADFNFSYEIA